MAALVALTLLLVPYNAFVVLRPLRPGHAVAANLAAGAALVAVARALGVSWSDVGLSAAQIPSGLAWGAGVAAGLGASLAGIAALPRGRRVLTADRRLRGMDPAELRTRTLFRIPLATALFEELAFRGVVLALWAAAGSWPGAVVASSAAFGMWHIGPGIDLARANRIAGWRAVAAVGGLVAVTAVGGVLLALLRQASGGILAPFLAHWAANALGTLGAFVGQRQG